MPEAAVNLAPDTPARGPRQMPLYGSEAAPLSVGEALRVLKKSWPFIAEQRRLVMLKCSLIVVALVFLLLGPWPLKIIIDNVIDGHPLTGAPAAILLPLVGPDRWALLTAVMVFLVFTLIVIGAAGEQPIGLNTDVGGKGLDQAGSTGNGANDGDSIWNGLFGYLETAITIDLTQRLNQSVRTAVYDRLLAAPLTVYSDQKIGDAVFRAMNDSQAIGDLLGNGILRPLLSFLIFLGTLLIVWAQFRNEPLIPLVAALMLPTVAIGSGIFGRLFRDQNQRMRERGSDVMAAFEERLAQVQLIKAFGQEAREASHIDAASRRSYAETLKLVALIAACALVLVPLVALLAGFAVYHLLLEVVYNRITLGDVILLITYGALLIVPMGNIGLTWASLQGAVAGMRRVHSVLDSLGTDSGPSEDGAALPSVSLIELKDVSLGYSNEPILHDVSLSMRRGEMIAIAGPSGVGKTTIIYAIARFLQTLAGDVYFDGHPSRAFSTRELRRRIGFVFQQEALFSASIADNIRYGVPEASLESVKSAARAAGAADFIEQMPQGYATILGRRGARLSVGQKQRIAIARALLRKPELLILDEPTAPLDSASERALMATLRELAQDRMVLIVAHRANAFAACDRVYFVDEGTIVASGTHDDLLTRWPAYARYLAGTQSEIPTGTA